MKTTTTLEQDVQSQLSKIGVQCSYEYPGYICIPVDKEISWNVGTAEQGWTGDLATLDGAVLASITFNFDIDEKRVDVIARTIKQALKA